MTQLARWSSSPWVLREEIWGIDQLKNLRRHLFLLPSVGSITIILVMLQLRSLMLCKKPISLDQGLIQQKTDWEFLFAVVFLTAQIRHLCRLDGKRNFLDIPGFGGGEGFENRT